MNCSYCFEQHVPGRWNTDETELVLDRIFSYCRRQNTSSVRLHWQGGEPLLLGADYWNQTLAQATTLANRAGVKIHQAMQTNLTLYAPWVAQICQTYFNATLGTSFEPANHRRFSDSATTGFHDVWQQHYNRALDDGLKIGVLSLLDASALHQEPHAYLTGLRRKYNIERVRFTFPFKQPGGRGFWVDPEKAGDFLCGIYSAWKTDDTLADMKIEPFPLFESGLRGSSAAVKRPCMYCGNCTDMSTAVLPNGDMILCDNFSHNQTFAPLGNIFNGPLETEAFGATRESYSSAVVSMYNNDCLSCRFLSICQAGCLARANNSDAGLKSYHYCQTMKTLLSFIDAWPSDGPAT